jgi:4-amino-4-deoxy-L-arabinose transferase-like glycosyltransferase
MTKKVKKNKESHSADELIHELEVLHDEVHKQNSRWRTFTNGIISGLGRTLGATVIFAIIIAVVSYIVRKSDAMWVTDLLSWLGLASYLNL